MKGTNKNVRGKKQPRDTTKFFAIELSQTIVDQMRAKKKEKNHFFVLLPLPLPLPLLLNFALNEKHSKQFSV